MDSANVDKVFDNLNKIKRKQQMSFTNTENNIRELKEQSEIYTKYCAELAEESLTWGNSEITLDLLKHEFDVLSDKYKTISKRCNELEMEVIAQKMEAENHNSTAENNIDEVVLNMQCDLKQKELTHSTSEKELIEEQNTELNKFEADYKSMLRDYNEKLKNAMTKNLQLNTKIAAMTRKLQ